MKRSFIIIGTIIVLIVVIVLGIRIYASNKNKETITKTSKGNETTIKDNNKRRENKEEEEKVYLTGKHNVEIKVRDYGTIKVELDADIAPITVTNFIDLVKEGFYDGLTFHRIISGFMIQGGDPLGNGTGGSKNTIKGEFIANGVKNTISHKRGVISMARATKYDSASSQFFIVHVDSTFLDGQYAGFGHVTSGMEIVDKICEITKVEDNNGTVLKANQPIIESIKLIN